MGAEGQQLREELCRGLGLLTDPSFSPDWRPGSEQRLPGEIELIADLQRENPDFFRDYNYGWALDPDSYSSFAEALLQARLLAVLVDKRRGWQFLSQGPDPGEWLKELLQAKPGAPPFERCANIAVRVIPSSCARPHLRRIGNYWVIVLTTGYLFTLQAFIRLWLEGCALGAGSPQKPKAMLSKFLAGVRKEEAEMEVCALACLVSFLDLARNKVPYKRSVFDNVVESGTWKLHFSQVCTAVDGFILFHEASHILAGHTQETERSSHAEFVADLGSVRFAAIDGLADFACPATIGAALFFTFEKLRIFCEILANVIDGRQLDRGGTSAQAIEELRNRGGTYGTIVQTYFGDDEYREYEEWAENMSVVSDVVRWAAMTKLVDKEQQGVRLTEYLARLGIT